MLVDFSSPIFAFNIVLFIVNFLILQKILQKYTFIKDKKLELSEDPNKIVADAQDRASLIIKEATDKAREVIGTAHVASDKIESDISEATKHVVDTSTNNITSTLTHITNQNEKLLAQIDTDLKLSTDQIFKKLQNAGEKEVADFMEDLKNYSAKIKSDYEAKQTKRFAEVELEVKEYKAKRIKEIDKEVGQVIKDIVKDALPNALSYEIQEEILLEAIKRAKADRVLVVD